MEEASILALFDDLFAVVVSILEPYDRFSRFSAVCTRFNALAYTLPIDEIDFDNFFKLGRNATRFLRSFCELYSDSQTPLISAFEQEEKVSVYFAANSVLRRLVLKNVRALNLVYCTLPSLATVVRIVPNLRLLRVTFLMRSRCIDLSNSLRYANIFTLCKSLKMLEIQNCSRWEEISNLKVDALQTLRIASCPSDPRRDDQRMDYLENAKKLEILMIPCGLGIAKLSELVSLGIIIRNSGDIDSIEQFSGIRLKSLTGVLFGVLPIESVSEFESSCRLLDVTKPRLIPLYLQWGAAAFGLAPQSRQTPTFIFSCT